LAGLISPNNHPNQPIFVQNSNSKFYEQKHPSGFAQIASDKIDRFLFKIQILKFDEFKSISPLG
jgi:hypothetical protein